MTDYINTSSAASNDVASASATERLCADRRAFDAYNVLYYPVVPVASDAHVLSAIVPTDTDWNLALAARENLTSSTAYTLSDDAVAQLALVYACQRTANVPPALFVNPLSDILDIVPDAAMGNPMYPDFPTQVIEMNPVQYRTNQILHYMSTYGMEFFASCLGVGIDVHRGWLPDVSSTDKTRVDDVLVEKHVLNVVPSAHAMASFIARELARPTRMPEPAVSLAVEFASQGLFDSVHVAFHENMMEILRDASNQSSSALESACSAFCQHPGDVLKAVLWCAEKADKNHIHTKSKKGFCRALEHFDAASVAHNIADLSGKGQKACNMLSVSRFGGTSLLSAIDMVDKGEVVSFNARIERLWKTYTEIDGALHDGSNAANLMGACQEVEDELLSLYGTRPGVLLRSISRLVKGHVPEDVIAREVMEHVGDYSLATLVSLETSVAACDMHIERDWRGGALNADDIERRERDVQVRAAVSRIVVKAIAEKLRMLETPLYGKKVLLDSCGFSLAGSVILPNETGNTSGAYPPAGMAYDVPADKTVRFFTFWDDRSKRVDVDLHFQYMTRDGKRGDVGWYSAYHMKGMTTSGDITHSEDAAEYLDIDMSVAAADGIDTVFQRQHIYCGAQNWFDIDTCFSGALLVGDTSPDVSVYSSKNVLFHDDLNGEGRDMDYAMVDVPNHYVRILRGTKIPFSRTLFTLETYIGMLLEAQGCELATNIDSADIVLSVGRAVSDERDGKPVVSLIDEKFFIG